MDAVLLEATIFNSHSTLCEQWLIVLWFFYLGCNWVSNATVVLYIYSRKSTGNKSATNLPPQNIRSAEYLPKNSTGRPKGRKKFGRGSIGYAQKWLSEWVSADRHSFRSRTSQPKAKRVDSFTVSTDSSSSSSTTEILRSAKHCSLQSTTSGTLVSGLIDDHRILL